MQSEGSAAFATDSVTCTGEWLAGTSRSREWPWRHLSIPTAYYSQSKHYIEGGLRDVLLLYHFRNLARAYHLQIERTMGVLRTYVRAGSHTLLVATHTAKHLLPFGLLCFNLNVVTYADQLFQRSKSTTALLPRL